MEKGGINKLRRKNKVSKYKQKIYYIENVKFWKKKKKKGQKLVNVVCECPLMKNH